MASAPVDARGAASSRCACVEVDGAVRHRFLSTFVDAVSQEQLLDEVAEAVEGRGAFMTANHNVNSLALLQRSPAFRHYYENARRTFVDGTLVVIMGRLLGHDLSLRHRIAALDYLDSLCVLAVARGWRLVHVGGREPHTSRAHGELARRYPGLDLVMVPGYFDAADPAASRGVLDEILAARPDVLLVGMGMPRQELWLIEHEQALPACPVLTVGGLMSFVAGERPTPPRWLGRIHLEWLYRVVTEPTRLWRRYFVEPLVLVRPVAEEWRRTREARP